MMETSPVRPATAASSHPDPPIRTLKVELLTNNSQSFVACQPNARTPTEFETEFFKGIAMMIVRTKPVDDHFKSFFMGKRMFEVQVQGKFKREPIGEIFVGAEAVNKLELGIFTKSISRGILKFISTMVNDLHYSFGDNQDEANYELPHVVSPIFPTFDKVLVTPPGETPPPLGIPFTEDPEFRKKRLKFRYIKDAQVDLQSIYSFSVNTSNLDLLTWTIVGLPMMKPMDLRTYSGDSSVQLVGYEIPRTVSSQFPDTHPHDLLNYVFCMKLSPIEPEETLPLMDLPILTSEDEQEPEEEAGAATEQKAEAEPPAEEEMEEEEDAGVSEEDEEVEDAEPVRLQAIAKLKERSVSESLAFDDRQRFSRPQMLRPVSQALPRKSTVSGWFRRRFTRGAAANNRDGGDSAADEAGDVEGMEGSEVATDYQTEAVEDLSYCPACIELNEYPREGRRRVYYLLLLLGKSPHKSTESPVPSLPFRLRTYSEITKRVHLFHGNKDKRLAVNEQRRRDIVETYRTAMKTMNTKGFETLLEPMNEMDSHFLGGETGKWEEETMFSASASQAKEVIHRVVVALATSRRHWSEYQLILSREQVELRQKKPSIHIPLSTITKVHVMTEEAAPVAGITFFEIETDPRVYTFMIRSHTALQAMLHFLQSCVAPQLHLPPLSAPLSDYPVILSQRQSSKDHTEFFLTNMGEEYYQYMTFIARPACWRTEKKRVYNYRRIFFKQQTLDSQKIKPNELSEIALATAFFLSHAGPLSPSESKEIWIKFTNEIMMLQAINLYELSAAERIAFFLNVYHIMFIHGCLMFGPPPAWNHWTAFFNHICYIVGFQIMSMAEIEHCILRAAMTRSSLYNAVAIAAPPQTRFPGLAVAVRDFRLHFAINCGSLSMLSAVPVYTPQRLDEQLDEVHSVVVLWKKVTRLALAQSLEIDMHKKSITLPKLPLADYVSPRYDHSYTNSIHPNGPTSVPNKSLPSYNQHQLSIECLRTLLPYLAKPLKSQVYMLLQDPTHISIKYRNLNFTCRMLHRLDPLRKPEVLPSAGKQPVGWSGDVDAEVAND